MKKTILKKDTLLLVDFLSMYYRGAYVHEGLTFEGQPTGGLFGMVKQLSKTIEVIKPTDIVFCSDVKPYFRIKDCPQYKLNRSEKTEQEIKELNIQKYICENFIDLLGIPFIQQLHYEADDLIALLIKKYQNEYKKIVIASNDTDLYQLFVYGNVSIYKGIEKGFYTLDNFKSEYPELKNSSQWNKVLAYTGGHNGFEGIHGIGIKTAIKIVVGKKLSLAILEKILSKESKEKVKRNIKLGRLPYYKIANKKIIIPSVKKYKERVMLRFLSKYGVTMTISMIENFNWRNRNGYT